MSEQKDLKELIREVLLAVHPVGSLFFTSDDRNPDVILFGGGYSKWKRIEGRFIYGASENRPIGQTGGEESHTLTVSELPSHKHPIGYTNDNNGNWALERPNSLIFATTNSNTRGNVSTTYGQRTDNSTLLSGGVNGTFGDRGAKEYIENGIVGATGGSQAHNNLPPFAVYAIWERIE